MLAANNVRRHSRLHADDDHDPIGSNGSTPPGVATPRPDLTDKRLPGITHSYFGQVGCPSRTCPNSEPSTASQAPAPHTHEAAAGEKRDVAPDSGRSGGGENGGAKGPLTAPNSPSELEQGREDDPTSPLLPHECFATLPSHDRMTLSLPTPPASSSSSIRRANSDESGAEGPSDRGAHATRAHSQHVGVAYAEVLPAKLRRHTVTAPRPLTSIVTAPAIAPAHLSTPAPSAAAAATAAADGTKNPPPNPSSSISSSSHPSTSPRPSGPHIAHGDKALTEGGTSRPREQSTPPQTPRTQSQEGSVTSASPTAPQRTSHARSGSVNTSVRPPRGRLSVSISEGRNLRPSVDPYVVCQFQWSEYISAGPINGEPNRLQGNGAAKQNGPLGGIAIRRTGSDMGRPMAIPMKSRQSSNTSITDSRDLKPGNMVTNPKWEHDAVL